MKRILIISSVLLVCGMAVAGTPARIIEWICKQEFNRTQLENVTWSQIATMAEGRGTDPNNMISVFTVVVDLELER